jgi:hypothetical protein
MRTVQSTTMPPAQAQWFGRGLASSGNTLAAGNGRPMTAFDDGQPQEAHRIYLSTLLNREAISTILARDLLRHPQTIFHFSTARQ